MKQKKPIFLITAFIGSLAIVYLISSWLNKEAAPEKAPAPATELVLTAPENMSEGAIVTIAKMQWTEWPADKITPEFIAKKSNDQQRDIEGGVVRSSILKGEPIKTSQVIKTHGKSALSAIIREGMRAVTVPFNRLANAPSLISPGDIIDVIIPKRTQTNSETFFGQTILTGVRVLAVNSELQKPDAQEQEAASLKTITLEVTASQAEDLAAAIRDGQVVVSTQSVFSGANKAPQGAVPQQIDTPQNESKMITIMRGSEKKDLTFSKAGNK